MPTPAAATAPGPSPSRRLGKHLLLLTLLLVHRETGFSEPLQKATGIAPWNIESVADFSLRGRMALAKKRKRIVEGREQELSADLVS